MCYFIKINSILDSLFYYNYYCDKVSIKFCFCLMWSFFSFVKDLDIFLNKIGYGVFDQDRIEDKLCVFENKLVDIM